MPDQEIVECYSNAEQCRRNALVTSDEEARAQWLQLAKDWQSLAKAGLAITMH